jgi:3-oxoacyl-[acyl-carrier-protein] synthase-3
MNGRAVFTFASSQIVPQLQQVMEDNGITFADVDAFCLHQGSGVIVDALTQKLGEHGSKVIKDMFGAGNTVSSTVPLLLEHYAFDSDWKNVMISGFGVGLSWGSALLKRHQA